MKDRSQSLHTYGRTPVWMRMCVCSDDRCEYVLSHLVHGNAFTLSDLTRVCLTSVGLLDGIFSVVAWTQALWFGDSCRTFECFGSRFQIRFWAMIGIDICPCFV